MIDLIIQYIPFVILLLNTVYNVGTYIRTGKYTKVESKQAKTDKKIEKAVNAINIAMQAIEENQKKGGD